MLISQNPLVMGQIPPEFSVNSGHAPLINTYSRDDIAIANSSLALAATQRARRRMTGGDVNVIGTSYVTVSDLSVPINRIGGIAFEYWLMYSTDDVTEGIGVQLAFSGTANGVGYTLEAYTAPATRANLVSVTSFGSGVAPYTAGPGATPCTIVVRGSCNVTAVGTLDLQIRTETGALSSTLLSPSWGSVWES